MSRPRWAVSGHAVRRYIERCAPELRFDLAKAMIREASQVVVLVGERNGASLYRDPRRPMHAEYVVARGRVVTVTNPAVHPSDIGRENVYAPVRGGRAA